MIALTKLLTTKPTLIPESVLKDENDIVKIGSKLNFNINNLFGKSLAIREVDAGSNNAEEHEINALSNCYYDCERFGIHFVASPRHADMLLVTGPVARNMAGALKKVYEATPDPKIVVALGDGAIDGGIFKGSYATYDGVHNIIPVHYQIPGDPPTPKQILNSLLYIIRNSNE
jgi:Ni,Fe-hydrogenase III small subunit